MKGDPDFGIFWSVYPRKDRKTEARFEWQNAARRFPADRIILTAAKYRADMQYRPKADILPAAAWLASLTEPERRPEVFGLNMEKLGSALLTAAMISRLLAHSGLAGTMRDYLAPHDRELTAEQRFVQDVLLGDNPVSEEEARQLLQIMDLSRLPAA